MHKKGGTKLGTLYERITSLCKTKGVSGSRMCLELGLSKSTMSDLKYGRIKTIAFPTAQKIAGYFGISVEELYGEETKKEQPIEYDELSIRKKAMIEKIKKMSASELDRLEQILALVEKE
jgi:transcriptional regulator with XRE-family HTH domain